MKNSSALISFLLVLCLLFLLSPLMISAAAQKPKCHPKDQKAIQQIQASFGINFTGDCCDWEFVTCKNFTTYSRVDTLQVSNSNISGQIPAAIGDLSYLDFISFINVPNLTGNIPPAITKLSKLAAITITNTSISGPIPTFPVNLTNFLVLELSYNALTGSIPSELPSWFPNLKSLELQNNKLTGTIPESLGNLTIYFSRLDLSHNSLTGPIPKSLGNLDPYYINLSGNKFSGDASFLFGDIKTTLYLYLDRNNFTFDLSNVVISTSLQNLTLSHNNIFGSLPQDLTQLDLLEELDVSYNGLCGKIPQGGRLQKFGISTYFHNKCLCGAPLPACVK